MNLFLRIPCFVHFLGQFVDSFRSQNGANLIRQDCWNYLDVLIATLLKKEDFDPTKKTSQTEFPIRARSHGCQALMSAPLLVFRGVSDLGQLVGM